MFQNLGFTALLLGVLVFVHEFGHFIVAKALNVKVLKFSIGFGPRIVGFTRGETEYRLSWIPLGGYVKMAGELPNEELPPQEAARGFLNQAPWKRALIVSAGPAFNLVFPILAYFFVFWGSHQATSTRVGSVEPGLPAAEAKLQPGDRITAVNGTPVRTFHDLMTELQPKFEQEITLTVDRGGEPFTTQLRTVKTLESDPVETLPRGIIGVSAAARPAVVGVPEGSPAAAAGLKTFDRIVRLNGQPVKDEVALLQALSKTEGGLTLEVARYEPLPLPGASMRVPSLHTVTLPRQPGEGYAALGAERSDLYVAEVLPDSPADKAGLRPMDRLVAFNGKPLKSFRIFDLALREAQDKPFRLTWLSGGAEKSAELTQAKLPTKEEFGQTGEALDLGVRPRALTEGEVSPPELVEVNMGAGEALGQSFKIVPEIIRKTGLVIAYLFTGKVPLKSVGGPIMLYEIASKSADEGLDSFLNAMAVISVNLGLMNLLPIPILDGFHLLAAIWEGVRRRPIPVRAREIANMVGLAMLLALMVLVFKNDLTR